ncbi:hypothetical protein H4W30_008170 [Amycolatopsis roodepoortensis]|uniref:Uncharacterized protein n=1 Tax=Amycolatopsis roodepoortensis TaxID=700274 RepID=A0ABR9LK78_9PSEU|nr:hypothetical protein [Amycolatopsis roodepoortensis]
MLGGSDGRVSYFTQSGELHRHRWTNTGWENGGISQRIGTTWHGWGEHAARNRMAVVAVVLDGQRGERRRLWVGLLLFLYIALSLGWVSAPTSFLVDAAAALIFVLLMYYPVSSGRTFRGVPGARVSATAEKPSGPASHR